MATRVLLLLAMCCALTLALLRLPVASHAIGKASPTPAASSTPGALDVETALEELEQLIERREYDEAVAWAGRMLAAEIDARDALFYRGFAHIQLDDSAAAVADFDAALVIRPWDSPTLRLRGDAHLRDKNPRAAKRDYERALFYNPRSLPAYNSLVGLHERDVDKARHDLYRALVDAGRLQAGGGSNRAIDILSEAIESFDRRNAPAELGYAYFARADRWISEANWESALADLTRALQLQPGMQGYYMARGFVHAETGAAANAGSDFYQRMTLLERVSLEGLLTADASVAIEMEQGLVARLKFRAEAGQRITIAARDNLGAGVDPLLALLDAAGAPLSGDDDGGGQLDALISFYTAPATGDYTAMVSHANSGYEGVIRLSLRLD